jgi:hypothetical protein
MLKKQRLLKMSSSQRKDVEKPAKLRWRRPSVWKSKCWGENQINAQLWIGQSKRLSFLCNNSSVNTPSGWRLTMERVDELKEKLSTLCTEEVCVLRRWTWTVDFKCREVKTGFCRNRSMQTGSSGTLIGWKSGQTTFVPLWDRLEGSWLWALYGWGHVFCLWARTCVVAHPL